MALFVKEWVAAFPYRDSTCSHSTLFYPLVQSVVKRKPSYVRTFQGVQLNAGPSHVGQGSVVRPITSCSSNYFALTWWGIVPGQETSIARRGPQGRPRRTYGGTSQGAPWGPATPLGEVGWNGTSSVLPVAADLDMTGTVTYPDLGGRTGETILLDELV